MQASPNASDPEALLCSGQSWLLVDCGLCPSERHHPGPFSLMRRNDIFPGTCSRLQRSSVKRTETKATPRRSVKGRGHRLSAQAESCPPVWGPLRGGLCSEEQKGGRGKGPRGGGRQVWRQEHNYPSSGPSSFMPVISENTLQPTENLESAASATWHKPAPPCGPRPAPNAGAETHHPRGARTLGVWREGPERAERTRRLSPFGFHCLLLRFSA